MLPTPFTTRSYPGSRMGIRGTRWKGETRCDGGSVSRCCSLSSWGASPSASVPTTPGCRTGLRRLPPTARLCGWSGLAMGSSRSGCSCSRCSSSGSSPWPAWRGAGGGADKATGSLRVARGARKPPSDSRNGTGVSTSRGRATTLRPAASRRASEPTIGLGGAEALASVPPPRHPFPEPPMKTILVVEDEMKIARLVRDYLEVAGFEVIVAAEGGAALASARGSKPDLVVLDLGLPGRDGLDVARELRRASNVPIIILTARGEESDRIVGLELGADDYVVKPFSPKELVARVRAVLRRTEAARDGGPEVLRVLDVEVDVPRMRVRVGGRPVDLTPTEFQLLETMAREPGRVFTRGQLLDAVHGVAFESYERAIDAHVKNIRRKIEPTPGLPRYLLTVHGVGYRFADA